MQGQRRAKPRTSLYKQLLSGSLLCLTLLGPGLTTRGQDREMKCHAAQVPRKPGAMVATRWSDVVRYQRQRRARTRSGAPRRTVPEKHVGVSIAPGGTGPACRPAVSRHPGNNKVHHVASPWQTSPAEHGPG